MKGLIGILCVLCASSAASARKGFFFLICLAVAAPCARADPETPSTGYAFEPGAITLVYDVEALGFPAATARFDFGYRAGSYDVAAVLRTVGVADWLVSLNMTMSARGKLQNTAVVPERYHEVRRSRALEIGYAEGKVVSAPKTPPSERNQRAEVAEAGRSDAADLLSLTLATILSINASHDCGYRGILFDGDRLYDLVVTLSAARSDAIVCVYEFRRRAYQAEQKDPARVVHDHDPQIYRVWFSRIVADGPLVPVRMVYDLDIGVVDFTLDRARTQVSRADGTLNRTAP